MGKEIKVALITGVFSVVAGAVGGSLITSTVIKSNNTNNNTIVITTDSGEKEIITEQDYEQIKTDKEELEEENKKLQDSIASNQQASLETEEKNRSFFETLYDGDAYEKYGSSDNTGELKIGGKGYTDAVELSGGWGGTPFALFNLDGKYQTVQFDIGRVDDSDIVGATLRIYLNGSKSGEYTIDAETPLTPIQIQVAGATTMKIELSGDGYKRYGLVNFEAN